jgi:hypothetical protein
MTWWMNDKPAPDPAPTMIEVPMPEPRFKGARMVDPSEAVEGDARSITDGSGSLVGEGEPIPLVDDAAPVAARAKASTRT